MIVVRGLWSVVGRSVFCRALCALLLALSFPASAQQPTKVPRIGRLGASSLSADLVRREAFRHGLRELGYVEGKNIVIEWRDAEGKRDRLPALAEDLVRLKVDVIVTGGGNATEAPREQLPPFRSLWRSLATLLPTGSSPAWRGRAGILRDCPILRRS